jgi:hypothetical protein
MSLTRYSTFILWRSISYIDTHGPFSKLGRSHNESAEPKELDLENGSVNGPTAPTAPPTHAAPENNRNVNQEYVV